MCSVLTASPGDDRDAFWLAQVYYTTGDYARAQALLARGGLVERNQQCRYLHAHCAIRLDRYDDALHILGESNPTHLVSLPGHANARQKLRHVDTHARAGARHGSKAGLRTERLPTSEERDGEDAANLKSEAAMCFLRGVCYAKQNAFDRARDCYKAAVQIDVQCYEAFDALMTNALLSPDDEWAFVDALNFDAVAPAASPSLAQEAADFTRNLYITRLSKYARPADFTHAAETLTTHYNLASNPDIVRAKADLLYTHSRFHDALALTSSVLAADTHNLATLPLHLAALHELRQTNALYLLAHDLADTHPDEPATWLAVAVYYYAINKVADARRYFSKATTIDPLYGPAWVGFGHTFAAEGEHDQAITAYSTAARLFQGSHLPPLFLGMQNLQLTNLGLAHEYLKASYNLCPTDPLLLNELGVVAYQSADLPEAIDYFRTALDLATRHGADPDSLVKPRINLAHALRRTGLYHDALRVYEHVLRHGVKDPAVFTAMGLVLLELDRTWDAVTALHEALALAPQDPIATDVLNRALEANESDSADLLLDPAGLRHATLSPDDEGEHAEFEEALKRRKDALRDVEPNRVAGRRGRRRRHAAAGFVDDESAVGESMLVDSDG